MTSRGGGAPGTRQVRTQKARIAALCARPRTTYRASQCASAAGTSFFSSLLRAMALPSEASGRRSDLIVVTLHADARLRVGAVDVGAGISSRGRSPAGWMRDRQPVALQAEGRLIPGVTGKALLCAYLRDDGCVASRVEGLVVRGRQLIEIGWMAQRACGWGYSSGYVTVTGVALDHRRPADHRLLVYGRLVAVFARRAPREVLLVPEGVGKDAAIVVLRVEEGVAVLTGAEPARGRRQPLGLSERTPGRGGRGDGLAGCPSCRDGLLRSRDGLLRSGVRRAGSGDRGRRGRTACGRIGGLAPTAAGEADE